VALRASGSCACLRNRPAINTRDRSGTEDRRHIDENRAFNWCKGGRYDQSRGACIAADFQYLVRVFSDFGLRWSRRSTLAFVVFAVIVVAFTALALSWNGLSAFRNSATADPALGPFMIAIPGTATPTPKPTPSRHAAGVTSRTHVKASSPSLSPKPKPAVTAKAKHKVKATHKPKPKATHTPKPKPTHTPKPKLLYIHTPKFVHTPKRKALYPPAGPPLTHYGVLAGVAGNNYKPR
jgi:hypothetical protein